MLRGKNGGGNSPEMDFESFLGFVLALENRDTLKGLTYLFRCLDLQEKVLPTTADIHTFQANAVRLRFLQTLGVIGKNAVL